MRSRLRLLLGLFPLCHALASPWPVGVVSVEYGPGAGFGQAYFPANVLGPPDSTASERVPSADPAELLSLGTGGSIVLRFDPPLTDGAGPDLTVFENAMLVGEEGDTFIEAGILAFSEDGAEWIEYPFDAQSFDGLAGVTPTCGSCNPLDPGQSGGDTFDLALTGLSSAGYVRITDASDRVNDDGTSFDLDALAALHQATSVLNPAPAKTRPSLFAGPNPSHGILALKLPRPGRWQLELYNLQGACVARFQSFSRDTRLDLSSRGLASGLYLLRASCDELLLQQRILLMP